MTIYIALHTVETKLQTVGNGILKLQYTVVPMGNPPTYFSMTSHSQISINIPVAEWLGQRTQDQKILGSSPATVRYRGDAYNSRKLQW